MMGLETDVFAESDVVIKAASMVDPTRNNNFAEQNVPAAANLAEKVGEVKGGECRSKERPEIVTEVVEVKYEVGDMVWAKVKSYPWWPGHIFKEDWAVPSVLKEKKEGHVLVAFFGDNSYGWFDPKELKPFVPHYFEKSKQTKLPAFLDAVEDAEDEISKRATLGLACWCRNLLSMRPINYFDWFYAVDIKGYDSPGVYSMKQIQSARDEFQPFVALSFVRQLALMPGRKVQRDVDWIKNLSVVFAYRKAVFEETDETCLLSDGDQSENYDYSTIDLEQQQEEIPFQVPQSRSIEIPEAVGQTKKFVSSVELTDQPERETGISQQDEKRLCTSCDKEVALGLTKDEKCAQSTSEVFINNNANPGVLETRPMSMVEVVESRDGNKVDLDVKVPKSPAITLSLESVLPGKASEDAIHIVDVMQDDLEHPGDHLFSEKAINVDNKKREKEAELQGSRTHQSVYLGRMHESLKINPIEESGEREFIDKPTEEFIDKSGQTILFDIENSLISQQQKENRTNHILPSDSVDNKQELGSVRTEAELCRVYADLLALALNPYHGVEQNIPSTVEKHVLQFRYVVYQQSIASSLSVKREFGEVKSKSSDFLASTVPGHSPLGARAPSLPSDCIPPKKRLKPNDYPLTCQQSSIHDNGEEISQRDQKRMNKSMALAAEEKARDPKDIKSQSRNGEKIGAVHVINEVKHAPKKPETCIKSAEPTLLIMRFPSKSALPSFSELKAKFVRFGPLDLSATHVSWNSSKCTAAFKCKYDALAAYDHATHNKFLFGNANVLYQLQALEIPPVQSQKSGDQLVNQTYGKDLQLPTMTTSAPTKPGIQQKTHMKKPQTHVTAHTAIIHKQTPSLKLVVDESESGNREQLVIGNNVKCSNYDYPYVNNSSPSSTLPTNPQQRIRTRPLPALPVDTSNMTGDRLFDKSVEHTNDRSSQAAPRQSIDISQQMLSNLIRCSEIINNLKSALGYVPLHL